MIIRCLPLRKMSRDELIVLVGEQAERITAQDGQITAQARQIAVLDEANEDLAGRLARVEHLLSRNSRNSSSPPSGDDDPGRTPPPARPKRRDGKPKRKRGKQSGAPGSHLAWTDTPNERTDRFPEGRCECGHDLTAGTDLGVVDRCQQHEIPQVTIRVTQYAVRCGCGRVCPATDLEYPAASRYPRHRPTHSHSHRPTCEMGQLVGQPSAQSVTCPVCDRPLQRQEIPRDWSSAPP